MTYNLLKIDLEVIMVNDQIKDDVIVAVIKTQYTTKTAIGRTLFYYETSGDQVVGAVAEALHAKEADFSSEALHSTNSDLSKAAVGFQNPLKVNFSGALTASPIIIGDGATEVSVNAKSLDASFLKGVIPTKNLDGEYAINISGKAQESAKADTALRLFTPIRINGVLTDFSTDVNIKAEALGGSAADSEMLGGISADLYALKTDIPQNVSQLHNDLQFITIDSNINGSAASAARLTNPIHINGVLTDLSSDLIIKAEADGGDAATVNGFRVLSSVPPNAKFTDTTYDLVSESNDGLLSSADYLKFKSGANLDSPTFTGNPKAPTPPSSTSDNTIATCEYVLKVIGDMTFNGSGLATNSLQLGGKTADKYALLDSPTFIGTPKAPKPSAEDSDAIATVEFVKEQVTDFYPLQKISFSSDDWKGTDIYTLYVELSAAFILGVYKIIDGLAFLTEVSYSMQDEGDAVLNSSEKFNGYVLVVGRRLLHADYFTKDETLELISATNFGFDKVLTINDANLVPPYTIYQLPENSLHTPTDKAFSILSLSEGIQIAQSKYDGCIYIRSYHEWDAWRRLAKFEEIPEFLPAAGGDADTVDGYHASEFVIKGSKYQFSLKQFENSDLNRLLDGGYYSVKNCRNSVKDGFYAVFTTDEVNAPLIQIYFGTSIQAREYKSGIWEPWHNMSTSGVVDSALKDNLGNIIHETYARKDEVLSEATLKTYAKKADLDDVKGNFAKNSTFPSNPVFGQNYFNVLDEVFYTWNGYEWLSLQDLITYIKFRNTGMIVNIHDVLTQVQPVSFKFFGNSTQNFISELNPVIGITNFGFLYSEGLHFSFSYELPDPIYKLGNTYDFVEIDFIKKSFIITRNIAQYTFSGVELWELDAIGVETDRYICKGALDYDVKSGSQIFMSNKSLSWAYTEDKPGIAFIGKDIFIRVKHNTNPASLASHKTDFIYETQEPSYEALPWVSIFDEYLIVKSQFLMTFNYNFLSKVELKFFRSSSLKIVNALTLDGHEVSYFVSKPELEELLWGIDSTQP